MKFRGRVLMAIVLLILAVAALFFGIVPGEVARQKNPVMMPPPYPVSAAAADLHQGLFVADLHADSLLRGRDLLAHGRSGHVDLPPLQLDNVGLQTFSVVTQVPAGRNFTRNASDALDIISVLAIAQSLEGELRNLDALHAAGFRMLGLVHFLDNAVGGWVHGEHKGGLTDFGRALLQCAEQLGMLIDVAHASAALVEDVLALATRPVPSSHGGVRGTCDNQRSLSDTQAHAIAASGGVIGIGFWPRATCGDDVAAIVRALRYAVDLVGVEHVALGSDFDGSVQVPFDASGLPLLTEALLQAGFSPADIEKVMGSNVVRVLQSGLPAG
jgi:microsomal dipeptidase-like Zn-dependent dipeptidase